MFTFASIYFKPLYLLSCVIQNWTMEIADKDNYVECSVGRGKASYLFFESFLMNIDGPRVNAIEHYTAHVCVFVIPALQLLFFRHSVQFLMSYIMHIM